MKKFKCSFCKNIYSDDDIIIKHPKKNFYVCRDCSVSKDFDDYVRSKIECLEKK